MDYAEHVSSIINDIGTSITLRTVTAVFNSTTLQNTNTNVDTSITASIRHYRPKEVGGLIQSGDREARIAAADLAAEPTPYDKIIVGGKVFNVISVNVRSPKNIAAIYILQIRG